MKYIRPFLKVMGIVIVMMISTFLYKYTITLGLYYLDFHLSYVIAIIAFIFLYLIIFYNTEDKENE